MSLFIGTLYGSLHLDPGLFRWVLAYGQPSFAPFRVLFLIAFILIDNTSEADLNRFQNDPRLKIVGYAIGKESILGIILAHQARGKRF